MAGDDALREQVAAHLSSRNWDNRHTQMGGPRSWWLTEADAVLAVVAKHQDTETVRLRAEVESLTNERNEAQEHIAYHLRDFIPGGDMKATGDLAVDMVAYASRWAEQRNEARDRITRALADIPARAAEWSATSDRMTQAMLADPHQSGYTSDDLTRYAAYAAAWNGAVSMLRAILADPAPTGGEGE